MDLVLSRMHSSGFPFSRVAAVSGCGQQHGSVYWGRGAGHVLASLDPATPLAGQLKVGVAGEVGRQPQELEDGCPAPSQGCFSLAASPVWMDSSTRAQCRGLEQFCSGAMELAGRTGSRAYEVGTGLAAWSPWQRNASH